ncbi:hypothetical protein [Sporomusa termitida]|uniref:Uncharacterized protein n=1 Tax=Sporomusa termitida TaxID=2377 RepID=A0A517DVG6_9FIRM|nr:hypothetical protein [Sporomusa termitida]QDR81317.1 hypothetical protein SPTER_26950 [Sporomusa termitida]
MLTVEQYIFQMKKKEKIDEFDFKKHAENMAAVMKCVVEYFNTYLNPEEYDYEAIKLEQSAAKVEKEIADTLPRSKNFIIDYYKKYKSRIDRTLKSHLKSYEYMELFFSRDDFEDIVNEFCEDRKMQDMGLAEYKEELISLAQELKERETEKPSRTGYKYLGESLFSWIKDTYAEYKVNLVGFAGETAYEYYKKYVENIYDRSAEQHYHINRYNHRYNNNPFGIDEIYKDNCHRPFIEGRKGELEMLIMYEWVHSWVEDAEYWPEYVNLCVNTGRVNIVRNMNILLPVINKGVDYPEDIKSSIVFVETTTGALKIDPSGPYILRLTYDKENDFIWKDDEQMTRIIANLQETFAAYGPPYALELHSPLRAPTYNEKEFFARYSQLEKKLKKYTDMTIALVNGPQRHKAKSSYLMQTTEDVIKIRTLAKELKLRLKISLDISKLITNKNNHSQFEHDFDQLSEIRHSIIGVHLANTFSGSGFLDRLYKADKVYLNQYEYPRLSNFLGSISALFNDNRRRYFVPEEVKGPEELEELADNLLRAGFSFDEWKDEQQL